MGEADWNGFENRQAELIKLFRFLTKSELNCFNIYIKFDIKLNWEEKYTNMKSKVCDHVKCTILHNDTVMTESIRFQPRVYDLEWKYAMIGRKHSSISVKFTIICFKL